MALGLGAPAADTLRLVEVDGSPIAPNRLTRRWRSACHSLDLSHAPRHKHASALIAGRLDDVLISRRLGVTLNVYGQLVNATTAPWAGVIEGATTRIRSEPRTR